MHRRYTHTLEMTLVLLMLTACGSTKVNTDRKSVV